MRIFNHAYLPGFCLIAALLCAVPTPAATVNVCDDASLRAAVAAAGPITFGCDGTILLTNTLTVSANTVIDGSGRNVILSGGGAVRLFSVSPGVQFTLTRITVADGFGNVQGGALLNNGSTHLIECTFSNNIALGSPAFGGAIYQGSGSLCVSRCSFVGNQAIGTNSWPSFGGAIGGGYLTPSGQIGITNSTFYGNGALSSGGAVTMTCNPGQNGRISILNCTFSSNTNGALSYCPGGVASFPTNKMILENTILANNNGPNCSGVTDGGHNLSSDASGGFTHPFSLENIDSKLGPLAYNGGPTLTIALLQGSPAIDSGNAATSPPTDQRGISRPFGLGYDVGAFESTTFGENPGAFRIGSAAYSRSESPSELVIPIFRADGAPGAATVNFATSDGSATAGADYVATNGTLNFAAGEVQKSLTLRLLDDSLQEADETFVLTLSAPTGGASLGSPNVATVTIVDDETASVVTVCDEASLRAAMLARSRVILACDGTILLAAAIAVSNSVSIDATGHTVAISGGSKVRHFTVASGTTLTLKSLSLVDGLAIGAAGGLSQIGGAGEGGSIFNGGGIVLATECRFIRNQARGGGGGPAPIGQLAGDGGPGRGGGVFNGAGSIFISSNCSFLFNAATGGTGGNGSVGGSSRGGEAAGGAVYNAGERLQISHSLVLSNQATSGQGRQFGLPTLSGPAYGGAIFSKQGEASLVRVFASQNISSGEFLNNAYGGAIHHETGLLQLLECHLVANRAVAGSGQGNAYGGAISMTSGNGTITSSTLSSNRAGGRTASPAGTGSSRGGAVFNAGWLGLTNTTLADNEAFAKDVPTAIYEGNSYGGGICNDGGAVVLSHTTLSGNGARAHLDQQGGGLFSTNGAIELSNTIIANSPAGSNCFGTILDGGHNISSDASTSFTASGSLNSTDPMLGPLTDYGGPTPTMGLLNGSPAIDVAGAGSCPATDQRGIARPFGAACDIGAFESSPPYTILGRITGFTTPSSGLVVLAGTSVASVPPGGDYALRGLTAGNYIVTPSSPEAVFVLSNRLVNVAHDTIGVNFHSYRSNALVIERIDAGIVKSVFAGEAGQTYEVQTTGSFGDWLPYSTNVAQPSGLFEFNHTNMAPLAPRLFRVMRP